MPSVQIWREIFLVLGGILVIGLGVYCQGRKLKIYRIMAGMTVLITLLSVWGYFRFGELHTYGSSGKHFYHYHEIYHYYIGSKYYSELGNSRLYDCVYVAMYELSREGVKIPNIRTIRSLDNINEAHTSAWVLQNKRASCEARFQPGRWISFKSDIRAFLNHYWVDQWWQVAFFDLGFNPPPSYSLFAGFMANRIPLTSLTLECMPWVDILLVFVFGSILIYRAFGFLAMMGFLIIFSNNWLASYLWTGGSYLRQVWFFLLLFGVCMLAQKRYKASGVAFGVASGLRIFPLFFAAGAVVSLIFSFFKDKANKRPLFQFTGSLVAAFAGVVILSVLVYGLPQWKEFLERISKHNSTYFIMHIGYQKLAVFSKQIGNQNFWFDDGLMRFLSWQARLSAVYQDCFFWHWLVKGVVTLLSLLAILRAPLSSAPLILGGCLFYFYSIPANYYYVYLAIWPVVLMAESRDGFWWVRMMMLFMLMVLIPIAPAINADDIIHNGYINVMIFLFLVLMYISYIVPVSFFRATFNVRSCVKRLFS